MTRVEAALITAVYLTARDAHRRHRQAEKARRQAWKQTVKTMQQAQRHVAAAVLEMQRQAERDAKWRAQHGSHAAPVVLWPWSPGLKARQESAA